MLVVVMVSVNGGSGCYGIWYSVLVTGQGIVVDSVPLEIVMVMAVMEGTDSGVDNGISGSGSNGGDLGCYRDCGNDDGGEG